MVYNEDRIEIKNTSCNGFDAYCLSGTDIVTEIIQEWFPGLYKVAWSPFANKRTGISGEPEGQKGSIRGKGR